MITRYVNLTVITLLFFMLTSCIDEYWPEIDKYENLLVVEGGISNEPGPYVIKLSKSSPIDSAFYIPYANCSVMIVDDLGETEYLQEWGLGFHITTNPDFRGQIGRSYKLVIINHERVVYESSFEELKMPVKIEKVYAEVEYHGEAGYDHELAGYQFYLDTEETTSDTNFYLWQMDGTYHYQSQYNIRFYYDGSLKPFNPADSLFNCWRTDKIKDIYTFNTTSLTTNQLSKFPLNYVNTEGKELTIKYSLYVKQHTINKTAFKFWNAIQKQNEEQGSLYSHQPYQIVGNIKNIDDSDEPVLGYFMVSGINRKRIFVDKIDAPFYYTRCTINEGNYLAFSEIWGTPPSQYPVYVVMSGGLAVPGQACADCRQKGGTIQKPYYWED